MLNFQCPILNQSQSRMANARSHISNSQCIVPTHQCTMRKDQCPIAPDTPVAPFRTPIGPGVESDWSDQSLSECLSTSHFQIAAKVASSKACAILPILSILPILPILPIPIPNPQCPMANPQCVPPKAAVNMSRETYSRLTLCLNIMGRDMFTIAEKEKTAKETKKRREGGRRRGQ